MHAPGCLREEVAVESWPGTTHSWGLSSWGCRSLVQLWEHVGSVGSGKTWVLGEKWWISTSPIIWRNVTLYSWHRHWPQGWQRWCIRAAFPHRWAGTSPLFSDRPPWTSQGWHTDAPLPGSHLWLARYLSEISVVPLHLPLGKKMFIRKTSHTPFSSPHTVSQVSFRVVTFCKAYVHTQRILSHCPQGTHRLGSQEPPSTTRSSTDQDITLFYVCFCFMTPYFIHTVDAFTLNSRACLTRGLSQPSWA